MAAERVEYRVVGIANRGPFAGQSYKGTPRARKAAEVEAYEARRRGNTEVRIQFRTVTETDWTDLGDHEVEVPEEVLGYEVGAIYESTYWGGAFAVLGETESGEVEVEQVVKGRGGKHYVVGSRWAHRTHCDHTHRKIGYALPAPEVPEREGEQ